MDRSGDEEAAKKDSRDVKWPADAAEIGDADAGAAVVAGDDDDDVVEYWSFALFPGAAEVSVVPA